MTAPEAKHILLAYRPWAGDADDPEVAEALAVCRADPELARWLADHCATQNALRAKFQGIKAPEGLLQQILSERPAAATVRSDSRRRLAAVLACVAIVISVWSVWRSMPHSYKEDLSFDGYRKRMTRLASTSYGMDLETNNLAAIQAYLRANQAPLDDAIPAALARTPTVGCGILRWQNKPVSMVCYRTGKALPPGAKSDLILFVINQQNLDGATRLSETQFNQVSDMFTASWQAGEKVYLLASFDEAELHKLF